MQKKNRPIYKYDTISILHETVIHLSRVQFIVVSSFDVYTVTIAVDDVWVKINLLKYQHG